MTSRYCYCPEVYKKLGRHVGWLTRIRRRRAMIRAIPDVFPICGYNQPVYPGK